MKALVSALTLTAALTSAALAGPVPLTDAQLDVVTAGESKDKGGGPGALTGSGMGVDPFAYGGGTDPGDALIALH